LYLQFSNAAQMLPQYRQDSLSVLVESDPLSAFGS
jgi:hypothetical protein